MYSTLFFGTRVYLFSPDEGSWYVLFYPKQLLRVSCISWCYFSKWYSIILQNVSLWCSFVVNLYSFMGHQLYIKILSCTHIWMFLFSCNSCTDIWNITHKERFYLVSTFEFYYFCAIFVQVFGIPFIYKDFTLYLHLNVVYFNAIFV